MSRCPPNLRYSLFTIYEILTFKVEEKVFFSSIQGDISVLEPEKAIFWSTCGMSLFTFLFLGELGTCLQNLIPTQGVEP
jgi:hypothetical protein